MDEVTAVLVVPFNEQEEHFIARFDAQTGMLRFLEAMRYKEPASEGKTPWLNEAREWGNVGGNPVPTIAAVTWFDEGTPWAVFTVDEVVHNVEVQAYVRVKGP